MERFIGDQGANDGIVQLTVVKGADQSAVTEKTFHVALADMPNGRPSLRVIVPVRHLLAYTGIEEPELIGCPGFDRAMAETASCYVNWLHYLLFWVE